MRKIDYFKLIMVFTLLLSLLVLGFFLINYLHFFSLFCQLLDIDLGAQTAVRCGSIRSTGQLLEGLDVLVGEGIGADGAERSRRASAGGEELNAC